MIVFPFYIFPLLVFLSFVQIRFPKIHQVYLQLSEIKDNHFVDYFPLATFQEHKKQQLLQLKIKLLLNLSRISKIFFLNQYPFSIRQHSKTISDLKQLWVSLSSKTSILFFDTSDEDAHLSLFFISVFYVCKSLNGERTITECHSLHYLGSYTSPNLYETFFDGGGFQ